MEQSAAEEQQRKKSGTKPSRLMKTGERVLADLSAGRKTSVFICVPKLVLSSPPEALDWFPVMNRSEPKRPAAGRRRNTCYTWSQPLTGRITTETYAHTCTGRSRINDGGQEELSGINGNKVRDRSKDKLLQE